MQGPPPPHCPKDLHGHPWPKSIAIHKMLHHCLHRHSSDHSQPSSTTKVPWKAAQRVRMRSLELATERLHTKTTAQRNMVRLRLALETHPGGNPLWKQGTRRLRAELTAHGKPTTRGVQLAPERLRVKIAPPPQQKLRLSPLLETRPGDLRRCACWIQAKLKPSALRCGVSQISRSS